MQVTTMVQKNEKRSFYNIYLFSVGKLASSFGTQIYNFALGLYVLRTTGSGLSFAAVMVFGMVPPIIFSPIAGILADRLDRKRIVVLSDLLSGAAILTFFFLATFDELRIGYIYLFSFILTTLNTFFNISIDASKPNLVSEEHLPKINSINQAITSIASISAPFVGGIIYAIADIRTFLLINGLSFIISAITEGFMDFNYNKKLSEGDETLEKKDKSIVAELKESINYFKQQKVLFSLMTFSVLTNFIFVFAIIVPMPYILNQVIKVSTTQYGSIDAMLPIGMLLGALVMTFIKIKDKMFKRLILVGSVVITLIFLIGIPVMPFFSEASKGTYTAYYMTIMTVLGFMLALANIPIMVLMQKLIPDNLRGRVFGLIGTTTMIMMPLGTIISGILLDFLPVYIIPITGGVILTIRLYFFAGNKEMQKL